MIWLSILHYYYHQCIWCFMYLVRMNTFNPTYFNPLRHRGPSTSNSVLQIQELVSEVIWILGHGSQLMWPTLSEALWRQPEEWFVALDIYMADNPGVEVKESDKCWEWMNNQWVEGVSWFLHYGFFVLLYSFSKLQRINVCIQSCHQYHPYLR